MDRHLEPSVLDTLQWPQFCERMCLRNKQQSLRREKEIQNQGAHRGELMAEVSVVKF